MPFAPTTTDVFTAIADARRREILELLLPGACSVTEIAGRLKLAQPAASKHLRVLKEVGLVAVRQQGQQRLYALNGEGLKPVMDWAARFEDLWNDRYARLDELLDELKKKGIEE